MEQLRQMCLDERVGRNGPEGRNYSALTQSPREWGLEPGKPCSGERLLLMFDRWYVRLYSAAQAFEYSKELKMVSLLVFILYASPPVFLHGFNFGVSSIAAVIAT